MAERPAAPAPDAPGSAPRSRRLRARLAASRPVAFGALVTLVAVLLYGQFVPGTRPLSGQDVDAAVAEALASVTPPPAFSELVYQAVRPSLVLIQTRGTGATEGNDGDDGDERGLGSGVVVNLDGDILTSLHVVDDAGTIELTFADGTTSAAEIVATQPENDIAVVRALEAPAELFPAVLGNPDAVRQGSEAYAMGSPFGLSGSISVGVISAVNRTFTLQESDVTLHGLIQIDAAVNPGNSGGPLLNRDGHVIGIVTALINPTDEDVFIGIGLAVPIDVAGGAAGLPPY